MAKEYFELKNDGNLEPYPLEFISNYQTALVLSLLGRGLLTQLQFERCMDKIQEQAAQNTKL